MKKLVKLFDAKIFALLFILLCSAFMSTAQSLSIGAELEIGRPLYSEFGGYYLGLRGDGNLILCDAYKILWESKTAHKGIRKLCFRETGNLVLVDSLEQIVWNNDAYFNNANLLVVHDDGNLAIHNKETYPIWNLKKPSENEYNFEKGYIFPREIPIKVDPIIQGKTSKGESISKGEELIANQYLISPNEVHKLVMTTTGDLILYNGDKETWRSGTDTQFNDTRKLTFQQEGNLTITNGYEQKFWDSESKHPNASILKIQNDGNVLIYSTNGTFPIWSAKDPNGIYTSSRGFFLIK